MHALLTEQPPTSIVSRRTLLVAVVASFCTVRAAAQSLPTAAVKLEVQRSGSRFDIAASALIACPVEVLWATLVDYERLPLFVPDMELSKVLNRRGDSLTVRQAGRAGWGPLKQRFELTMEVTELPLKKLSATAIAGDVISFESSYSLRAAGSGRVQVDYAGRVEPKAYVPPLLGTALMRASMQKQFEALLNEALRRAKPV